MSAVRLSALWTIGVVETGTDLCMKGGREGGRKGGREGGRKGGRKGGGPRI